jgi:hypothetical protein
LQLLLELRSRWRSLSHGFSMPCMVAAASHYPPT